MAERDMNRDPISGEPGSHPVGTGVGSAGGAATGAAFGAPFGPIGMLIGGAIGAVAGGAAGHAAGESIDPTGETEYWKHHHSSRPYFNKDDKWDDYEPAYRYGWESHSRNAGKKFGDVENDLQAGWDKTKGNSRLAWDRARNAVHDAWDRTDRTHQAYQATDTKWRTEHKTRDYFDKGYEYDRDYAPAYRYGTFSKQRYADRSWDDSLERDLERDWSRFKGTSRLSWDRAKMATRDAWHGDKH
jgi:hypothetical protein